jgi:3-hydroxybutyrate dehydrogenase
MGQLDGLVAAVTGGTRGIGRGIAEAFVAEGASVVMNGRSADKGAQAVSEMNAGDRAHFIAGDVTKRADVEGLIDGTISKYGKLDILVNNAGGAGGFAPVADMTDEAMQEALLWNVWSTFWGTRKALASMIPAGFGRIINISSVEGKHGKAGITQYVTAKHAINGFTKSTAKEIGTTGVTINAICPGLIITDIVRDTGPMAAASMGMTFDEMVAMFAAESAIQKPNTVEQVAAVAVLLASQAGAGITGALWSVDGGTAAY